jgi:alpha-1,2-mannosyltransferase
MREVPTANRPVTWRAYCDVRTGDAQVTDIWKYLKLFLLALTLLHLTSFTTTIVSKLQLADGLLLSAHEPIGGDFINLLSAAQLAFSERVPDIYIPERFLEHERTIIPADIGIRLWAYPPHSLLFIWPLGALPFFSAFLVWSLLGLAVLGLGARRFGFDRTETLIILLSPATVQCLWYGQTGNLFGGLMLLALAGRGRADWLPASSAALLTIKPQIGFLLALLWLVERRWRRIVWTVLGTLVLLAGTVMLFGRTPWIDYVTHTLALLNQLEREGTGMFMMMIPSIFISGRIIGLSADTAGALHWGVALLVASILAWRLPRIPEPTRRAALLLFATTLITPYIHTYDLGLVLIGALIVGREYCRRLAPPDVGVAILMTAAWGLPNLVIRLNEMGLPASPLLLLALFLIAAFPRSSHPTVARPARA